MESEHRLDRDANETQEEYDVRIDRAAAEQSMTREEYERQANEEAGRPPITRPGDDSQE